MKKQELYTKTVDILVAAYFNETLVHGDCYACAIGNIIAANMGYKMATHFDEESKVNKLFWLKGDKNIEPKWDECFKTVEDEGQIIDARCFNGTTKQQLLSTGYHWNDLADIEIAFETASKEGDYMFNGLMAVVDVLDRIHENTDTVATQKTKLKFRNKELQPQ